MTQCISRRRGSDLRPSIMRPVCFLQPARVRHVHCVSPYPPKPCQALPPPMGSPAAHWLVGVYSNTVHPKRGLAPTILDVLHNSSMPALELKPRAAA